MNIKDTACAAVTFHINSLGEGVDSAQREAWLSALEKIDPLFEASSWIQNVMDDKQKITKIEGENPKTFYTESIKKPFPWTDPTKPPTSDSSKCYPTNLDLPNLVLDIFNRVTVEEKTEAIALMRPKKLLKDFTEQNSKVLSCRWSL